ncbi:MAG: hypothetical protein WAO08_03700 [Hyphomicrobiaceae bacterium]
MAAWTAAWAGGANNNSTATRAHADEVIEYVRSCRRHEAVAGTSLASGAQVVLFVMRTHDGDMRPTIDLASGRLYRRRAVGRWK